MTLTLKDLINAIKWSEVEKRLVSLYPEEKDFIKGHKRLYWKLFNLQPNKNSLKGIIDFEVFIDNNEDFDFEDIEIHYVEEDFDSNFCYEYTDEEWETFLNFEISERLNSRNSKEDILLHILIESFYGEFLENQMYFFPTKKEL